MLSALSCPRISYLNENPLKKSGLSIANYHPLVRNVFLLTATLY